MSRVPLVSIVITNYNYARYLKSAIDSALSQRYSSVEVIVVDDGSKDDSRNVIRQFGDRVTTITKENGGQASALNRGFLKSNGDVILFLDSDDYLLPTAAETAVRCFNHQSEPLAKIHWPLWVIDEKGERTGATRPAGQLPHGELSDIVRLHGPSHSGVTPNPPTTGNAWSRHFLEQVFPIPEAAFTICADAYLFAMAPVLGRIESITDPQGCYRIHANNNYSRRPFLSRLQHDLFVYGEQCKALERLFQARHEQVDSSIWKKNSWLYRVCAATNDLITIIPDGKKFVLVDDDLWGLGTSLGKRQRFNFLECRGVYWGHPADDVAAIRELDRLRAEGAEFIAIAWTSFWWLRQFQGFAEYLCRHFTSVLDNDRLIIFNITGMQCPPKT